MNYRENYIRNATFNYPEWMPITIAVTLASLIQHKHDMERVINKYPDYFISFQPKNLDYSKYGDGTCNRIEVDSWGYKWHYTMHGIEGAVIDPPLDDWSKFDDYKAPDSDIWHDRGGRRNWELELKHIENAKKRGDLTSGGLVHGFLFLRMQYLRGFENLMMDMALEEPRLFDLIEIIDRENLKIINKYCKAGVDLINLPEDLGAQNSLVISRNMFLKYILPSYKKLIAPCKENNILVSIHSDGYILDILDDLIEVGMDIINPQDLCNGIDNLRRILKGRVCIKLDLDRVKITPHGTRNEIFNLIEEEIKVLGSREGGLEFIYGVYPPTGPDQVAYVCEAFDKYKDYWFK